MAISPSVTTVWASVRSNEFFIGAKKQAGMILLYINSTNSLKPSFLPQSSTSFFKIAKQLFWA
jgi:hypothetical protein